MNKVKFNQNLPFKIFMTVLLATGLTLAVVGSFSFFFTQSVLQKFIIKNELAIAKHNMNKIDRTLYERYLDIQAIAGEEPFKNYLLDYVEGAVAENKKKSNLKRIKDLTVVTGPWDVLFVIDKDGSMVLSTREEEIGLSVAGEPNNKLAFEAAIKGEVYYSDFTVSDDTNKPTIIFAAPIKDNTNPLKPVIGAIVGDFSWMAILQILDEISANAILLNQEGGIIGSNRNDTQEGIAFNKSLAKLIIHKITQGIPKPAIIPRAQEDLPEDTLVSLVDQKGYLSYKGNGWRLVLSQPIRSVFELANKSAGQMVLILLPIIMLMSGGILFIVNRIIIDPVTALTQTVRDISSGDLTKQTPVTSNDEIGQLAKAFNDMTRKLRESHESLEARVKQRTNELREIQENTRLIIETATDAFVTIDTNGFIIDWNRQAESILGWTRSEAIGKLLAEIIIPPQFREAHSKGLKHFIETGQGPVLGKTIELSALHRNGSEFPIEITIWPIQIKGHYQFNAFLRDISKRKEVENELKKMNQELSQREKEIRQTLNELQKTHNELKQAQNQLLQSEKLASIGQLAAGVAHEINNPVGFISNNMEMLGQYIADYGKILRMVANLKTAIEQENWEKSKSIVQEMAKFEEEINLDYIINDINNLLQHNQRGIERIQKIVLDLRTFAREDKDTMDLMKIEEVIDSILSIVHNELKYKAELKKSYGETPLIRGNAQRLGQVFINLFVNAGQAIDEKGTIEVKTYTKEKFVCVDVIDTGKGIPESNLKKVFDAFFTTKPIGQGTGLGLSVSYEIVKKHGGDIKVQSKVGEGATFTVMLPVD